MAHLHRQQSIWKDQSMDTLSWGEDDPLSTVLQPPRALQD
jgi:hypothetical protein